MNKSPRLLAIGDIHASAAALDALLTVVAPTTDDVIVTLGDCVDSAHVIERLIRLSAECRWSRFVGITKR